MESIVEDSVSESEIRNAKSAFEDANVTGEGQVQATFQYAYCLIKSQNFADIKKGVGMLENLYYQGEHNVRRDYLYYIAIGKTRMKDYRVALDCVEYFLKYEPENRQAFELKDYIKKKLTKEGMIGMAIAGGTVLAVGGLIGMLLSKKG